MFKVAVFSSKKYDQVFINRFNQNTDLVFEFFESKLSAETVELAHNFDAICIFVNDEANTQVLHKLTELGIKTIALRCAGFNNVDIECAQSLGMKICRVPEYSPEAVAEHTVGLMLTLSRKFHKAYNRIREDNFSLDGLMGFNLNKKTVGIIGAGHIGLATLKILKGFGCKLIANDPYPNPEAVNLGVNFVELEQLFSKSDIISLHCPLNSETRHIINEQSLNYMKPNAMLINTSRGGLIDSHSVVTALKRKKLGYLGIDVYELESNLFFEDLSGEIIQDDIFARLSTFPNVLITGHQGFFTEEAISTIANTTINSLSILLNGKVLEEHFLLY
ncbi:2-hydroxyacid dehydrogenase [Thalassotalea sp. M1531]|uniref:2-hydroxyacid dehydrogenase n=1 Tax=Thalassotalea algicola TaxID=2716224 RepID=A0A7Y0LFF7_9GAMM|nr:2-hydroxyacid dehydrogenase [Thalassotalea algicola]NMP33162.1 2-hydroxyacid dehydrogenase [Thalassotalea algicola]